MKKQSTVETDLENLINIGKNTSEKLKAIGINTPQEFLKRDPYEIFDELLTKVDPTLCNSFLAGLVGASKGVKWSTVSKESAEEFKKRYPNSAFNKNSHAR